MDPQIAFYIAQGISILTAVITILSAQLKNMKAILLSQIIANSLATSTYFLLGGFSGAGIGMISIIQTVVMYFYNAKDKKPHLPVTLIFIFAYVLNSALSFKTVFDIFPALAAVTYSLALAQTKPKAYRFFNIWNPLSWTVYDIYTAAYGNMLMHVGFFISLVIASIRLDCLFGLFKGQKNKNNLYKGE